MYYRDKQDRHEIPSGVKYNDVTARRYDGSLVDTKPLYGPHLVADNEYAALQECAPFQEPKTFRDETIEGDNMMERFLALLTPKERSVIELVVFGQMSLFQAGIYLGREYGRPKPYSKALVAKYRDSALQKMRNYGGEQN